MPSRRCECAHPRPDRTTDRGPVCASWGLLFMGIGMIISAVLQPIFALFGALWGPAVIGVCCAVIAVDAIWTESKVRM